MGTNCKNCGAPVTGPCCEYCGTRFEDQKHALELAIGRTVSVSFEYGGMLYEFDMVLENVAVDARSEATDLWSGGEVYMTIPGAPAYEADLRGRIVPSERHGGEGYWFARQLAPEEITC